MTTKAQRQLAKEWDELCRRHARPLERGAKANGIRAHGMAKLNLSPAPYRRTTPAVPSRTTPGGQTPSAPVPTYTGSAMIGVATMHKSNTVPVFDEQAAVDLAHMRR